MSRFIQSINARGSLGCTREQLALLLTYYQVMPSFLDLVLTFEYRDQPLTRAIFRHEDYLAEGSEPFSLPELGRSGLQIQHAFNLVSIENNEHGASGKWFLRQVATYHSFDVQNGRSLWIVLKGNPLIARRFLSASGGKHRQLKAKSITSPETSFIATLHMQIMIMDWCIEDWAEYTDDLDSRLQKLSTDARTAHVDEATKAEEMSQAYRSKRTTGLQSVREHDVSRQGTFERPESRSLPKSPIGSAPSSPTMSRKRTLTRSFSDLVPAIRRLSTFAGRKTKGSWPSDLEKGLGGEQPAGENGDNHQEEEAGAELIELSKNFSFKQFQRLNSLGDDIEQARVVIEQNMGVLREIREHYEEVIASHGFKTHIKSELCKGEIAVFFRRVKSVERELDNHLSRLNSLARGLENEKVMVSTPIIGAGTDNQPRTHTRPGTTLTLKAVHVSFAVQKRAHLRVLCQQRKDILREDGAMDARNAPNRAQHGTGDGLDACHHHLHSDLPTRHFSRCKISPPALLS